jgi:hypothetical protein
MYVSVNDKDYNEVKLRAVHRSSGIYFTAEEKPGKSQLGDHVLKAVQLVFSSNRVIASK